VASCIAGGMTLLAAIIGALVMLNLRSEAPHPNPGLMIPQPSTLGQALEFVSIDPIRQPVSRIDSSGERPPDEISTFRLKVHNSADQSITIRTGRLRITKMEHVEIPLNARYAMARIDHRGIVSVVMDDPQPGKALPLEMSAMEVGPHTTLEFTLWLKPSNRYARAELLNMSATLTLEYNGQETTSDRFDVRLYTGQAVAALTDPSELFRDVP